MDFEPVGFFGRVSVRPKAGDAAPEIQLENRKLTVLAFYPDTSHNPQAVGRWNSLVRRFSGKPVQFVWVTREAPAHVDAFLEEHPIEGSFRYDPEGSLARSFGLEVPECVIVGRDHRIIGFCRMASPDERTVSAALEGKITTVEPDQDDVDQLVAFFESGLVHLSAEPERAPRPNDSAGLRTYEVHITPSKAGPRGGGNFGGMDFLSLKRYGLKQAIHHVTGVSPIRIVLPGLLDGDQRYDFALVVPEQEDKYAMHERMLRGIESHFGLASRGETREGDVYAITVTDREPPRPEQRGEGMIRMRVGSVGYRSRPGGSLRERLLHPQEQVSLEDIIEAGTSGTIRQFCSLLEGTLDRPVVDETGLEGKFKVYAKASQPEPNDFLARLREETGLVIAPARRGVEFLVFDPVTADRS